jgi:cytochrome P450
VSGDGGTARELPRSRELSGFGGLAHFAESPILAFAEAQRLHGDFVRFELLRQRNVLVFEPRAIEAIIQSRGALVKDFFTQDLAHVLGQGLLTAEGETWRKKRKLVAPAFQPHGLGSYGRTMVDCADEALARFTDGESRDVYQDSMHLTLDIVARSLFGAKLSRFLEVEEALADVSREYQALWQTFRALLPRWAPLAPLRRLKKTKALLDEIVLEVIRKKREEPGADLLSHLIGLRDEDGFGMNDRELLEESMTLFLAGHETTALALTYTLYLLAEHPQSYQTLLAETDGVLGGRAPEPKDMERLAYTNAVVKESLRLYPPVWTMGRLASDEVEVGGVRLRAGEQFIVPQWVVQRDPRWFSEPDAFRPERFLGDAHKALPRFAYFPFGGGPRVCIGQHFAMLELVLVVARLSQSFVFEMLGNDALPIHPVITLRPRGPVMLRVRRRMPPNSARAGLTA